MTASARILYENIRAILAKAAGTLPLGAYAELLDELEDEINARQEALGTAEGE